MGGWVLPQRVVKQQRCQAWIAYSILVFLYAIYCAAAVYSMLRGRVNPPVSIYRRKSGVVMPPVGICPMIMQAQSRANLSSVQATCRVIGNEPPPFAEAFNLSYPDKLMARVRATTVDRTYGYRREQNSGCRVAVRFSELLDTLCFVFHPNGMTYDPSDIANSIGIVPELPWESRMKSLEVSLSYTVLNPDHVVNSQGGGPVRAEARKVLAWVGNYEGDDKDLLPPVEIRSQGGPSTLAADFQTFNLLANEPGGSPANSTVRLSSTPSPSSFMGMYNVLGNRFFGTGSRVELVLKLEERRRLNGKGAGEISRVELLPSYVTNDDVKDISRGSSNMWPNGDIVSIRTWLDPDGILVIEEKDPFNITILLAQVFSGWGFVAFVFLSLFHKQEHAGDGENDEESGRVWLGRSKRQHVRHLGVSRGLPEDMSSPPPHVVGLRSTDFPPPYPHVSVSGVQVCGSQPGIGYPTPGRNVVTQEPAVHPLEADHRLDGHQKFEFVGGTFAPRLMPLDSKDPAAGSAVGGGQEVLTGVRRVVFESPDFGGHKVPTIRLRDLRPLTASVPRMPESRTPVYTPRYTLRRKSRKGGDVERKVSPSRSLEESIPKSDKDSTTKSDREDALNRDGTPKSDKEGGPPEGTESTRGMDLTAGHVSGQVSPISDTSPSPIRRRMS